MADQVNSPVSSLSSVTSETPLKEVAGKLSKKRLKKLRQKELHQEALRLSQKIGSKKQTHKSESKSKSQSMVKSSLMSTKTQNGDNPAIGERSTPPSPLSPFKIPRLPPQKTLQVSMNPRSPLEELETPQIYPIFKKARRESVIDKDKENKFPTGDVSGGESGKSLTFEIPKNFHLFMPILNQMVEASKSFSDSQDLEDGVGPHTLSTPMDENSPPSSPVKDHAISEESSEEEEGLPSPMVHVLDSSPASVPVQTPGGVEVIELSESQKIKQQKVLDFANMKPGKTASRIQSQVDKIVDAKQLAPRLQPSVALAINEFFINSKYADELAELGKKYPKIENLDRQVPPILDTVLDNGAGITPNHVANDTALKNIQKGLMGVITVLAEGHSLALARGSEDSQLDDLGVKFEEAMKMVALASSGITIHRRQSLKNLLDAKYSKVLVNHSKITDFRYLFGGDLSEKKKETDIARGFAKAVFRQAPSLMSQQRGQARGGPQRGRGFSPQNAPRGRFDARSGSYPTNRGHYHQRGQSNQYQNQNWNNNQNYSRGGGRGSNRGGHNQSQRGRGNQQN